MKESEENIGALITTIKTETKSDVAASGAIALLNVIPFAGGAIASIIGEVAAHRRLEKVCEVLADLNGRLESHGADPEQHLSKDQIVEVVHETLQTVTTASDGKKIEALKRGLGYAFLSDDVFERKQLFLQVLRGCTSLELTILPALYDVGDPFLIHEREPPDYSVGLRGVGSGIAGTTDAQILPPNGYWEPFGNKEECRKENLLTFLSKQIGMDEGATEGAGRLLDGKGLASAGLNLQRRDCKVLLWRDSSSPFRTSSIYLSGSSVVRSVVVKPTPLEASRTTFGKDFLRFCRTE